MEQLPKNYLVAKYDISGIQDYIFSSNRLKENAGASYNVSYALKQMLPEVLQEVAEDKKKWLVTQKTFSEKKTNDSEEQKRDQEAFTVQMQHYRVITDWESQEKFEILSAPEVIAEIIYIGGGNAMVVYRELSLCQAVNQELNHRILEKCEGIYLACAFLETDLSSFGQDHMKLNQKLTNAKNNRIPLMVHPTFPVVQQDPETGLPVTQWKDQTLQQYQKIQAFSEGKLLSFNDFLPTGKKYAEQTNDLAELRGESAYVAVIHIDGNGMGKVIAEQFAASGEYCDSIADIRRLSRDISQIFQKAFLKMTDYFNQYLDSRPNQKDRKFLPMRPLIMDGDDVTLICSASYGIPIAAGLMQFLYKEQEQLGEEKLKDVLKTPITACAGIAFVHSHFPFALAYTMAEDCCAHAKEAWFQSANSHQECWLDFRVVKDAGLGEDPVDALEQRYRTKQEAAGLRRRPYRIVCQAKEAENRKSKECVDLEEQTACDSPDLVRLLETMERAKQWPNSRLERLYSAYWESEQEVERVTKEFLSRGYSIAELGGERQESKKEKTGNESLITPVFDMLELIDLCDIPFLRKILGETLTYAKEGK